MRDPTVEGEIRFKSPSRISYYPLKTMEILESLLF